MCWLLTLRLLPSPKYTLPAIASAENRQMDGKSYFGKNLGWVKKGNPLAAASAAWAEKETMTTSGLILCSSLLFFKKKKQVWSWLSGAECGRRRRPAGLRRSNKGRRWDQGSWRQKVRKQIQTPTILRGHQACFCPVLLIHRIDLPSLWVCREQFVSSAAIHGWKMSRSSSTISPAELQPAAQRHRRPVRMFANQRAARNRRTPRQVDFETRASGRGRRKHRWLHS